MRTAAHVSSPATARVALFRDAARDLLLLARRHRARSPLGGAVQRVLAGGARRRRPTGARVIGVIGVLGAIGVTGVIGVVVLVVGLTTGRPTSSGSVPGRAGTASVPPSGAPASGDRIIVSVYTTGYTWFDNTPPGSGRISHPVVHRTAGGSGTYDDPITMAVGHSLATGADVLDVAAGTRFYVPHVRRYFVVEDSCGDGSAPQRSGCHDLARAPADATLWVDLYVGGTAADRAADVQRCAGKVTDGDRTLHVLVANPRRDYPVVKGALFDRGRCTALYPDAPGG